MASIELFTIQMAQWRKAKALGIKFVDSTAKSGISVFAPDMRWVIAYKAGEMSEEEYIRLYSAKMLSSQDLYPKYWNHFKTFDKVAIACYCPANQFCHRKLLVDYIKAYLEKQDVVVNLMGEIQ